MALNAGTIERAGRHVRRFAGDVAGVLRTLDTASKIRYVGALARRSPAIFRRRSLVPADEMMAGRTQELHLLGTTVRLDGADFPGVRELYCRRVYFADPHVQLRPDDIVIDLGANCGLFTVLAAKVAKRVVAVEAQSGFLPEIKRRLIANGCADRVDMVCALVGGETGVFSDAARWETATASSGQAPVPLSMKELLARTGVERIGFLKMDIEGSEFALFGSAQEWLGRVDRMAMELHTPFGDPATLQRILSEFGFRSTLRDADLRPVSSLRNEGYLYAWRP